jgi:hypothetical protein
MTRRAMERLISRVKSLKNELAISRISPELLMDPLKLVKRSVTEVLPFHVLLRANLWESSPATSIGSGQTSFRIGEEIPEMFCRSKVADFVVSIDIPHKLSEEVLHGHLA